MKKNIVSTKESKGIKKGERVWLPGVRCYGMVEDITRGKNYLVRYGEPEEEGTRLGTFAGDGVMKTSDTPKDEKLNYLVRIVRVLKKEGKDETWDEIEQTILAKLRKPAEEPEELVKVSMLQVVFNNREQYERAKKVYDSEGESQFWAGDWHDEMRAIDFAEEGELDALEKALTDDMEYFGLTGYHFERGETNWV